MRTFISLTLLVVAGVAFAQDTPTLELKLGKKGFDKDVPQKLQKKAVIVVTFEDPKTVKSVRIVDKSGKVVDSYTRPEAPKATKPADPPATPSGDDKKTQLLKAMKAASDLAADAAATKAVLDYAVSGEDASRDAAYEGLIVALSKLPSSQAQGPRDQLRSKYQAVLVPAPAKAEPPKVEDPAPPSRVALLIGTAEEGQVIADFETTEKDPIVGVAFTTFAGGEKSNLRQGQIVAGLGMGVGGILSLGDRDYEARQERFADGTPVLRNGNPVYRIRSSNKGIDVFDAQLRVHYIFSDDLYNSFRNSVRGVPFLGNLLPGASRGRLGVTFGSNLGGSNAYMLGFSFFPGQNLDFAYTVGLALKQVSTLKPGFRDGDAIFENSVPTNSRYRPGLFIGASFNFNVGQTQQTGKSGS